MGQEPGNLNRNARGAIIGSKGTTVKQAAFALEYVANAGDQTAAAHVAGYAEPRVEAYKLMALPHVVAAIYAAQDMALMRLGNKSITVLGAILNDKTAETKDKIAATKAVFARIDARLKQQREAEADDNPLGDMDLSELRGYVRHREEELRNVGAKVATLESKTRD